MSRVANGRLFGGKEAKEHKINREDGPDDDRDGRILELLGH